MTVDLIFRTQDLAKWGAGKGSNLTASQVDINFWNAKVAIEAVQAALGPAAVGIVSFTVSGDQFYVNMTDSSVLGPYQLPMMLLNFRQTWTSQTNYAVGDVIQNGLALYTVIFAHTSQLNFDPGANDGSGHNYYSLMFDLTGLAMPVGGTTGQLLAKLSNADSDTGWTDPPIIPIVPTSAELLSVNVEYLGANLVPGGDLMTDPSGHGWSIFDSVWSAGSLTLAYSGGLDDKVDIPITGLEAGSWYILEFTGTLIKEINRIEYTGQNFAWTRPGSGSIIFEAKAASASFRFKLDVLQDNTGSTRILNSVFCRKISPTDAVTISDGIRPVAKFGYEEDALLIGAGAGKAFPAYLQGSSGNPLNVNNLIGIGNGVFENAWPTLVNSIAIGHGALANDGLDGENLGGFNVAIGTAAMIGTTHGGNNVAIGDYALAYAPYAYGNIAIGPYAGFGLEHGTSNIFIGAGAAAIGTSDGNVFVGTDAMGDIGAHGGTGGAANTAIGYRAGANLGTGSNNTFLGYFPFVEGTIPTTVNNSTVIGANARITESNIVQLGDPNVVKAYVGDKAIGLPMHKIVAGAAAGNITVAGINVGDRLDEVIYYPSSYGIQDVTTEFTISATNQINNAGGTNTSGGNLIVRWTSLT